MVLSLHGARPLSPTCPHLTERKELAFPEHLIKSLGGILFVGLFLEMGGGAINLFTYLNLKGLLRKITIPIA